MPQSGPASQDLTGQVFEPF